MHPMARRTDVIVTRIGGEAVVYDRRADRAHSLNPVAAFVFLNANGRRSAADIAEIAAAELATPDDAGYVEMTLQRLDRAGLLEEPFTPAAGPAKITRREVMRRLGLVAMAVPIVTSMVAPTPAMAQSGAAGTPSGGKPNGSACSADSECMSGRCLRFSDLCGFCVEPGTAP